MQADVTIRHRLDADYYGAAGFIYTVTDDFGQTAQARVDFTIPPVNDAPVTVPDMLAATEDTAQMFTPAVMLSNDWDMDNAHAYSIYCLRHIVQRSRKHYSAGIHSKTRHDTGLRPPRPGVRQLSQEKQVVHSPCAVVRPGHRLVHGYSDN